MKMFKKTRQKLEEKYVTPVQQAVTLIAMVAVAAFLMAFIALMRVGDHNAV